MDKYCKKCDCNKPIEAFNFKIKAKDIRQSFCRDCEKVYADQHREERREVRRLYQLEFYKTNTSKLLDKKRAYYLSNSERVKGNAMERYKQNPEDKRAYANKRSRFLKLEALTHYGTVCTCCGESNQAFLTLDHPNNDGKEHRKVTGSGSRFYQWLRTKKYPEGYHVLCFNCNCGRQVNGGICPHKATLPFS